MSPSEPAHPGGAQHVVTGLLRRRGRALLVHRTRGRQRYPDSWDLPGGHVLAGEAPEAALVRQLAEALGISASVVGEPFARVVGPGLRMQVWTVDRWGGEPFDQAPDEHDALAWLTADELAGLRLADPRLAQLLRAALTPSDGT